MNENQGAADTDGATGKEKAATGAGDKAAGDKVEDKAKDRAANDPAHPAKGGDSEDSTENAPEDEVEASKASLLEHLIELRQRLMWSLAALLLCFILCFYFAAEIYDLLLYPYTRAAGERPDLRLIYTAPQEFFFTQLKVALFGGLFIAFPVIAGQLYMFVAPGLYRDERRAFLPFLLATPLLFLLGALLVYYVVMPLALRFFIGMEQSGEDGGVAIELLPRVSEYLGLVMTLIFAFGICFQLPVLLCLLARVGLLRADSLRAKRKYAVVGVFGVAALLTPPDFISQLGLGLPTLLLYEISILCVAMIERKHFADEGADRQRQQQGGV